MPLTLIGANLTFVSNDQLNHLLKRHAGQPLVSMFAMVVASPSGISCEAVGTTGDLPLGWSYSLSSYTR